MEIMTKIKPYLQFIYPENEVPYAIKEMENVLKSYSKQHFKTTHQLDQKNIYLITYGDSFIEKNYAPLTVLKDVVDKTLKESITDIHLLPMFPYTSDDGFSVTDYLEINPVLGDWDNINDLSIDYRLMFDFVANHMSKKSEWFQQFLNNDNQFQNSFVEKEEDFDFSNVIRPRVSPLFHSFTNKNGVVKEVWTTFSEDQVDVNVKDPKMLARLTGVLLEYLSKGASSVRLDAIGFLWKESGSTCMHLPQTHAIIKMWRTIIDEWCPNVQIITETNVPHQDNISYFGNGGDEANQVYQFPLPPLVLHTFLKGDSKKLSQWASNIDAVSSTSTYFNFLASHDGIGLRPTEGILTDEERDELVNQVLKNGGKISYKQNPDGSQSVYEMNINYSEALNDPSAPQLTPQKMIAAHHILLSLIGVPAIYYHSIFGSKNDEEGVNQTGINRRINREKLVKQELLDELKNNPYRQKIFNGIKQLIKIRKQYSAFDPYAKQQVINLGNDIFAVRRFGKNETILSLTNITSHEVNLAGIHGFELIHENKIESSFTLSPYQTAWIKESEEM